MRTSQKRSQPASLKASLGQIMGVGTDSQVDDLRLPQLAITHVISQVTLLGKNGCSWPGSHGRILTTISPALFD